MFVEEKMIEKKCGRSIQTLKTNNDLEFVDGKFLQYCFKEGIICHRTCAGRPQHKMVLQRKRIRHC